MERYLFVHFLGAHLASEGSGGRQVATMSWVGRRHHVSRVEDLLCKLRHGQCTVVLAIIVS
jgi:hypothetical protein